MRKLLEKQFGVNWAKDPELIWYNEILQSGKHENLEDEGEECDCMEPDTGFKI